MVTGWPCSLASWTTRRSAYSVVCESMAALCQFWILKSRTMCGRVRRVAGEKRRATGWGLVATAALAVLIVLGSRNLAHFDAALVGYTFATLFAAFGIVYRYAMWLQRPPTRLYWRRGWELSLQPKFVTTNVVELVRRFV